MFGTFSGGGLGMGVAFTLQDKFSRTSEEIQSQMAKLDGVTEKLTRKMEQAGNRIKLGFGMMAVGVGLLAPIAMSIKVAADFEQTQIAFETLLGSAEAATKKLNELKIFAANTPFELKDVTEYSKGLLAMGITADKLIPDMKALGDLAAGLGADKLPQLVHAFGQVNSGFKLTGRELNEFIMAGVPLLEQLAKNLGKSPPEIKKMIEEGKVSFEMTRKALYDLTSGTGKFSNLMEKQSKSALGMWSNVKDNLYQAAISIGTIFLPMIKKLVTWLGGAVQWLKEFAASPAGKFIFKLVAAIGVFLIVGGGMLILLGFARLSVMRMAGAFGSATKAQILNTIATKGTVAGLRAIGRAAWAATGPFIIIFVAIMLIVKIFRALKASIQSTNPVIMALGAAILFAMGPIGWIILGIQLMKRAVNEFNRLGENGEGKKGGFIGFLQKIGGIITGLREIWKSWNDDTRTFTLTKSLEKKLDALGIKQTVINLGTWIARVKWFLKGIKDAFVEVWGKIKEVVKGWLKSMEPVTQPFEKWQNHIKKSGQSMEKWRDIGKKVGYVLIILLGALIIAFLAMGAVALIVLFLMLAPFLLIGYAIYKLKKKIDEIKAQWALAGQGFTAMWNSIVAWFEGLPDRIYQAGVNFVNSIWQGIKDAWKGMMNWISDAWGRLGGLFGLGFGKMPPVEQSVSQTVQQNYTPNVNKDEQKKNSQNLSKNKLIMVNNNQPVVVQETRTELQTITMPVYLDGNKIADHVLDKTQLINSRREQS